MIFSIKCLVVEEAADLQLVYYLPTNLRNKTPSAFESVLGSFTK